MQAGLRTVTVVVVVMVAAAVVVVVTVVTAPVAALVEVSVRTDMLLRMHACVSM